MAVNIHTSQCWLLGRFVSLQQRRVAILCALPINQRGRRLALVAPTCSPKHAPTAAAKARQTPNEHHTTVGLWKLCPCWSALRVCVGRTACEAMQPCSETPAAPSTAPRTSPTGAVVRIPLGSYTVRVAAKPARQSCASTFLMGAQSTHSSPKCSLS